MHSLGHIAMQTLQRLHPNELFTEDLSPFNINTLFGHAKTHFSHPSQSSIEISICESTSSVLFSFFFRLKNEPKPILIPKEKEKF